MVAGQAEEVDQEPAGASPGVPWARVVAVGVLAGATSGLFGVGGGVIMVPALVVVARFAHKVATGTSLTAIVPIAISGVVGYATAGEVDWAAALAVAAGALVGAVVGTQLLRRIEVSVLQYLFASLMVVAALRMLFEQGGGSGRGELDPATVAALALVGLGSGVLAGLFGVGGGILIVPALVIGLDLPLALAKGTSLAVIIPSAVVGTLRNRSVGLTALRPAAVVGTAGMVSAFGASRLSIGLNERVAAGLFAGLLVVVAVRMVVVAYREPRSPKIG